MASSVTFSVVRRYIYKGRVMAKSAPELIGMRNGSQVDRPTALPPDDETVLVAAARHDVTAFALLYRRYVTPIYRYLLSRTGNEADAQDLTAQVFLEALEGLPRYRERGSFAAWLFTIARRRATDQYRHRSPLPLDDAPDFGDDNDPLSRVIEHEALDCLKDLIVQLDDDQRDLLRLRFAAGLTFGQIGIILGRSEAAVKMAVHRLLDQLRAKWGAQDERVKS
jgi:RNA polymerase sigma-70 factor (ECF subfamily)